MCEGLLDWYKLYNLHTAHLWYKDLFQRELDHFIWVSQIWRWYGNKLFVVSLLDIVFKLGLIKLGKLMQVLFNKFPDFPILSEKMSKIFLKNIASDFPNLIA